MARGDGTIRKQERTGNSEGAQNRNNQPQYPSNGVAIVPRLVTTVRLHACGTVPVYLYLNGYADI
eukprot:3894740-Pyramimonas_sp.AAC.1